MSCLCHTSIKLYSSLIKILLPSSLVGQAINMLIPTPVRYRTFHLLSYSRKSAGGSRHIEPAVGGQAGGVGQYVDPYTGSNRYVPPSDTGPRDVGANNVDPFTGAQRPKSVLPVVRTTP